MIITSVGTSLITNIAGELRKKVLSITNSIKDEVSPEICEQIEPMLAEMSPDVWGGTREEAAQASAEANGLLKWSETHQVDLKDVHHYLVGTDTWLGRHTCDQLEEWLQSQGAEVVVTHIIPKLRAGNSRDFRDGLCTLINEWPAWITPYQNKMSKAWVNATGGFKPIQSALQLQSALDQVQLFYIFQGSTELINIPSMPISLDVDWLEAQHGADLRRAHLCLLDRDLPHSLPHSWLDQYPDGDKTLLLLNEWGELMWSRLKQKVYSEKIIRALPSDKLVMSENAHTQLSEEAKRGSRFMRYNEQLDKICLVVEGNRLESVELRRFESMRHEGDFYLADLESDRSALRLVLQKHSGVYTITRIISKSEMR